MLIGSVPLKGAYHGEGSGPILLDDVVCRGTEDSLLDCSHGPLFAADCGHSEDAGVRCQGTMSFTCIFEYNVHTMVHKR